MQESEGGRRDTNGLLEMELAQMGQGVFEPPFVPLESPPFSTDHGSSCLSSERRWALTEKSAPTTRFHCPTSRISPSSSSSTHSMMFRCGEWPSGLVHTS
ncbi:hypothetical protein ISCGN_027549 [Ixodes scapularis]